MHLYSLSRSTPAQDDDPIVDTYVFSQEITDVENAKRLLEAEGVHMDGYRCQHSYDCCANWYPGRVEFSVEDGRVVARQSWRQNI